ncbi:PIN domain-containing protein [Paenarthrobacter nicotinovorans]|uniref:PIN domain-containing protein n=1 Tax=Paenarthrobacter nicotinovorans TaxID=29320 RepID=UPI00119DB95A|nr:PIN domain-containing protein [Paenarthrobacter nicotinovorans]
MAFRVLIDACVLLPYQLCDLLLRLGETDIYQPVWSDQILEEVERNLVTTLGRTEQQAARRVGQMRKVFPHAELDLYPQQTTRCLQQQRAAYRNPSFTRSEFYNSLSQTAPQFAVAAQESEGAGVYLELVAGTAHETVPGG